MKTTFWGVPIQPSLYTEAQQAIEITMELGEADLSQATRIAFDLISKLIFGAITSYYRTPIEGQLPPLPANVTEQEAIEGVGLGLVFVAGRYLQGRTVRDLKDLAQYLDRLLLLHPETQQPCLALPLTEELEVRTQELLVRARLTPELFQLRGDVHGLIIDIVEASVSYYFEDSTQNESDHHLQQVIYYGIQDISESIAQLADQLLPTLPAEYLLHFFQFVDAMFFQKPE